MRILWASVIPFIQSVMGVRINLFFFYFVTIWIND